MGLLTDIAEDLGYRLYRDYELNLSEKETTELVAPILAKVIEAVEGVKNEYADVPKFRISHRVWEEACQAVKGAINDKKG